MDEVHTEPFNAIVKTVTKSWPSLTRRVSSDDLLMPGGDGTAHYPHAGEWVDMKRKVAPGDVRFLSGYKQKADQAPAAAHQALCAFLAHITFAWSWTGPPDSNGICTAYPEPHDNPVAFYDLQDEEVMWLMEKFQQPAAVSKN